MVYHTSSHINLPIFKLILVSHSLFLDIQLCGHVNHMKLATKRCSYNLITDLLTEE